MSLFFFTFYLFETFIVVNSLHNQTKTIRDMNTENLKELDQEQLKGVYQDAFNTRFMMMEMGVDASNIT